MAPWAKRKATFLPVGKKAQTATSRNSKYTPITPDMIDETFQTAVLEELVKRAGIRQSPESGNFYLGTDPSVDGGFVTAKNAAGQEISARLSATICNGLKLANEVRQAQTAALANVTPEQLRKRLAELEAEAEDVAAAE